jgi:two-component system response regulator AtoC
MARVLVVDDEESLRLVLRTLLKKHGYEVEVAVSGEEGLAKILASPPDFVITDIRMGGMDGIALVKEIRKAGLETVVIVMSAYGSIDLAIEAMQAGAYDYVAKPFRQDEVLLTLKKAEEREELRRENKALREAAREQARFEEMLGQSEEMRRVFRTVEKAAATRPPCSSPARAAPARSSSRAPCTSGASARDKPFVAVNCGAIPETLLESELFGHKRAPSPTPSDKAGLFEEADGGTLFLDEIGELPLALQVKLLRVLQERTIRRVGDVRGIARSRCAWWPPRTATSSTEVKEGASARTSSTASTCSPMSIPPLRERAEDIPLLVEHFLARTTRAWARRARARPQPRCQGCSCLLLARQRARAREPDRARDGARRG